MAVAGSGAAVDVRWDPPGPGTWSLDAVHLPRPATAHLQEAFPAIGRGFEEASRNYGWLAASFDVRSVNGFMYSRIGIARPDEFEERLARCEEAFATKRWRAELAQWDDEAKPAALAAHRALIAIDPRLLDDANLRHHLDACREHHFAMWTQHHRFNGTHMIPVGDFLVAATSWTGLPANRIALLLRGASPVSRGASDESARLGRLLRDLPEAVDAIEGEEAPERVLARLAAIDDAVADELESWVALTGSRLIEGFDITNPTGWERPKFLVGCLRALLRNDAPEVDDAELAEVRSHVPPEHRDDFDERLFEARLCYRVRDERGIYSDAMAAGILRRAMLECGERLAARSTLPDRDLALQATTAELIALLDGADDALVRDLERRRAWQASRTVADAPAFLGDPPGGPPALDGLPPAAARMVRALLGVNDNSVGESSTTTTTGGERVLHGVAVSGGTHRGVARIIHSPDDFDKLDDGDVLVAVTTGEAFNVAIAMVGAVVTDQGNVMCHAAITTREYGIPAVVGTVNATRLIPDGAVVEVDGDEGTIRWS